MDEQKLIIPVNFESSISNLEIVEFLAQKYIDIIEQNKIDPDKVKLCPCSDEDLILTTKIASLLKDKYPNNKISLVQIRREGTKKYGLGGAKGGIIGNRKEGDKVLLITNPYFDKERLEDSIAILNNAKLKTIGVINKPGSSKQQLKNIKIYEFKPLQTITLDNTKKTGLVSKKSPKSNTENLIKKLFKKGYIKFLDKPATLSDGTTTSVYLDFRSIMSDVEILKEVALRYVEKIEEKNQDKGHIKICGIPNGATVLSAEIAFQLKQRNPDKKVSFIQATKEEQPKIFGEYQEGDLVTAIEDVFVYGYASKGFIKFLKNSGLKIEKVYGVDRNATASPTLKEEVSVDLCPVFDLKTILKVLKEIEKDEKTKDKIEKVEKEVERDRERKDSRDYEHKIDEKGHYRATKKKIRGHINEKKRERL